MLQNKWIILPCWGICLVTLNFSYLSKFLQVIPSITRQFVSDIFFLNSSSASINFKKLTGSKEARKIIGVGVCVSFLSHFFSTRKKTCKTCNVQNTTINKMNFAEITCRRRMHEIVQLLKLEVFWVGIQKLLFYNIDMARTWKICTKKLSKYATSMHL